MDYAALIREARERARFLESPIPQTIAEQESEYRYWTENGQWPDYKRGSQLLKELANALARLTGAPEDLTMYEEGTWIPEEETPDGKQNGETHGDVQAE